MRSLVKAAAAGVLCCVSFSSAYADTYVYDALGRLSRVTYPNGVSVTYSYDANGNRTQRTVAANRAPVANADSISTTKNTAVSFDPRSNDTDPDGDPVAIHGITQGANGTVTNGGDWASLIYTPNTNFVGNDSFTVTVTDGVLTSTATVTVTVNAPPSITITNYLGSMNGYTTTTVLISQLGSAGGGSGLSISSATAAEGSIQIAPGGQSFQYTAPAGPSCEVGLVSGTYTLSTSNPPGSASGTLSFYVQGPTPPQCYN